MDASIVWVIVFLVVFYVVFCSVFDCLFWWTVGGITFTIIKLKEGGK